MIRAVLFATFVVAILIATAGGAQAESFEVGFEVLENNSGENAPGDFTLKVSNDAGDLTGSYSGSDLVFILTNNHGGGEIFELYWDTNAGAAGDDFITTIVHESDWGEPPSPPGLPGGGNLTPKFAVDFGSDGDKGLVSDGLDDGDTGTWGFDLQVGHTFADIKQAFMDGDLRFGFHIRSVAADGSKSDTYITTNVTPEPGTLGLLGLAIASGVVVRRRRRSI